MPLSRPLIPRRCPSNATLRSQHGHENTDHRRAPSLGRAGERRRNAMKGSFRVATELTGAAARTVPLARAAKPPRRRPDLHPHAITEKSITAQVAGFLAQPSHRRKGMPCVLCGGSPALRRKGGSSRSRPRRALVAYPRVRSSHRRSESSRALWQGLVIAGRGMDPGLREALEHALA